MNKLYTTRQIILIVAIFLICTKVVAQFNSGKITYKVELTDEMDNPFEKEEELRSFLENYRAKRIQLLPYFYYELKFTPTKALFSYPKNLEPDNTKTTFKDVASFVGVYDQYYFDLEQDELINQQHFFNDELILVKSTISHLEWDIHPETKEIKGYLCQKATLKKYNYSPSLKYYNGVVVWFTKDLPFPFGPGFGGLPGMILGLEINSFYIYADKIDLNDKDINIYPPKKGRKLTDNEFRYELEEKFRRQD